MAGLLIDARARFTVARCAAIARRQTLADGGAQTAVDIEFLDAELRAAMSAPYVSTGYGFDLDGRIIE